MTVTHIPSRKKKRDKASHPAEIAFCAMALLSFVLLLCTPDVAITSMHAGLRLCANTVIPSLFPFMVISELLVKSGAASLLGKLVCPLFSPIFGLSKDGSAALVMGTLSGFPVGARTAAGLYEEGKISKQELSFLLCFCNNPSSAFVISAIGISLFGCRTLGVLFYAVTLLSAATVGIVCRFLFKASKDTTPTTVPCDPPPREKRQGAVILTECIADSARSMLSVCAFVSFFSVWTGCLNAAFSGVPLPDTLRALAVGFFELTGGVSYAASCASVQNGMDVCAFLLGWSGISVHFQIMSICQRCQISFRPYFAAKAATGVLSVLFFRAALSLLHPKLIFADSVFTGETEATPAAIFILVCFFASILLLGCHTVQKKFFQKRQNPRYIV